MDGKGCKMIYVFTGPLELVFPASQDEHIKLFRWYWFMRGVDIRRNCIYNNRGVPQYGKSYEQVAKEYGR